MLCLFNPLFEKPLADAAALLIRLVVEGDQRLRQDEARPLRIVKK